LREKYGFRVSDFSVDSDARHRAPASSSAKAAEAHRLLAIRCRAGQDKPALSVDDQQICVEGLKHGESYSISLREGLPSTVGRTCSRPPTSASMCATAALRAACGKAYVLPKTGQQAFRWSV
jgi:hypothetical protein